MRISDWSSDVCSSDLCVARLDIHARRQGLEDIGTDQKFRFLIRLGLGFAFVRHLSSLLPHRNCSPVLVPQSINPVSPSQQKLSNRDRPTSRRTEERRVGKEGFGTYSSRGSRYH